MQKSAFLVKQENMFKVRQDIYLFQDDCRNSVEQFLVKQENTFKVRQDIYLFQVGVPLTHLQR